MTVYLKSFITITLIMLMALWVMLPSRFDVLTPRLGIPANVKAGEPVTVDVSVSNPFASPDWKAWLSLRDKRYSLALSTQRSGINQYQLSFQVPPDIVDGSYTLIVSDGLAEQPRPKAVNVIEQIPDQITIIQLADLPELKDVWDGVKRLNDIIDEINIINPDLVLMTGDVAYGGAWLNYQRLLKAMQRFNMPVVAVPGNHEYEGWAAYLTLLGKPYHTVQFGDFEIISLNSGHGRDQLTEVQFNWLKERVAGIDGRIPLIQIHHPLFHRPDLRGYVAEHVKDMAEMFKANNVPIVLSGHWHGDAVYDEQGNERLDRWDFSGTPYVVTTAAGADLRKKYSTSPMHHGYRLIRINTKKENGVLKGELLNYTYDYDGDGARDATSSIPVGQLKVEYHHSTSAEIENNLNESLSQARIRFTVKDGQKNLQPNVGTLVDVYKDDDSIVYEVEVPVEKNTRQQVTLIEKTISPQQETLQ